MTSFIKKAVFPVAGLGSRFLPVTKANPKEMLPIVDKPLIQYAVEEAVRAGLSEMIFITSSSKRAIEDHFDLNFELEYHLQEQGKSAQLNMVKQISPGGVKFTYVRQDKPLGLGHALLCAQHAIGDEPFAVLLADDLIDDSEYSCLSSMLQHFTEDNYSVIAVQPVPLHIIHQYGVVQIAKTSSNQIPIIQTMIEKPNRKNAPSNLAAIGRYVFTPALFECLKQVIPDHRGEIQLTDGIANLINKQPVKAYTFNGKRYDCGSKLGYLQASVELGLRHSEIGSDFAEYLQTIKKL